MADELIFNLTLTDANGESRPFQFTTEGLRELIAQMLSAAAAAPVEPNLDRKLTLDEQPIPANGFVITPYEGDPTAGHVSIGIGPMDLQFGVSLSVLMAALARLKQQTEPDPTSLRRPH